MRTGIVCFCIYLVMNVRNYKKVNQVNVFCTAEARNQHLQEEHEGEEYEDTELDGPYFKQRKVQYYVHQVIASSSNTAMAMQCFLSLFVIKLENVCKLASHLPETRDLL